MNKWLFRLYVVFILLGVMMVTVWRTFAPVMFPMGAGIIGLSVLLIKWDRKTERRK